MSDSIYKIIPAKPDHVFTEQEARKVRHYLRWRIRSDGISFKQHGHISFIDCGENLESISCPRCGKLLSLELWQEMMDHSSQTKFSDLTTRMPCCGAQATLNSLVYHFPCGFAKCEIDILNPSSALSPSAIQKIEKLTQTPIRIIEGHY